VPNDWCVVYDFGIATKQLIAPAVNENAAAIKSSRGMVNPIRSAGLPADSITPRTKTYVFMSTLNGGEKLGFDSSQGVSC
jgi:hypothetical protein